jgi:hypothetical protein
MIGQLPDRGRNHWSTTPLQHWTRCQPAQPRTTALLRTIIHDKHGTEYSISLVELPRGGRFNIERRGVPIGTSTFASKAMTFSTLKTYASVTLLFSLRGSHCRCFS